MKKMISLAVALLLGASGAVHAQKQEAPKPAAAPAAKSAPPSDAKPMDINSASEMELASLPKIGEARAKAIVKARPYNGKDDLLNKKVIPQDAYDAIKDSVIAKQAKKDEPKKDAKAAEPKKDEKKK